MSLFSSVFILASTAIAFGGNPDIVQSSIMAQASKPSITINMTQADNSKTIHVKNGETFDLRLQENPSTGFQWSVSPEQAGIVKLTQSGYEANAPQRTGSGGHRLFTFLALKPGKTNLYLHLFRPWEGERSSVKDCKLQVEVSS
jgi:predicted secreted protein